MSTSVLLVLSALLIVAGAVSITAAAMGNPIRIGRATIPGPETSVERAVIAVMGAVCVAAVVPVLLVGGQGANATPLAVAGATGTPDPESMAAAVTPSATPSPEPAAGPSAVTPTPGVPLVTSISVAGGPANGCTRTFTASVRISDGPVNVVYRNFVDGVQVGPTSRTKQISGTGLRTLDSVTVTSKHSGPVKVRFDVIDPNPNLLTGTATWDAPAACAPVVQPPATTTPPAKPALSISMTLANFAGACDVAGNTHVPLPAHVEIETGPTVTVTWTLTVDSSSTNGTVLTTTDLPLAIDLAAGDHAVKFEASSPDTNPSAPTPITGSITVSCMPPPPP